MSKDPVARHNGRLRPVPDRFRPMPQVAAPSRQLAVAWIGASRPEEFRPLHGWLAEHALLHETTVAALRPDDRCDVVILAQARRGEFTPSIVATLRESAPLATIVHLVGPWGEGEVRSGRPLDGVVRLYSHEALPRVAAELARLAHGRPGGWSLPATARDEERSLVLLSDVARSQQRAVRCGTLAVVSDDWSAGDALAHAARTLGWPTVSLRTSAAPRIDGLAAVVWDVPPGEAFALTSCRELRALVDPAPLLALVGFPRHDFAQDLRTAGAAAILPKPCNLADLAWQLDEWASRQAGTTPREVAVA